MNAITLADDVTQLSRDFINCILAEFQTVFFRVIHRRQLCESQMHIRKHTSIGVNPAGDTGDVSPPKIGLRGTVMHYVPPPQT